MVKLIAQPNTDGKPGMMAGECSIFLLKATSEWASLILSLEHDIIFTELRKIYDAPSSQTIQWLELLSSQQLELSEFNEDASNYIKIIYDAFHPKKTKDNRSQGSSPTLNENSFSSLIQAAILLILSKTNDNLITAKTLLMIVAGDVLSPEMDRARAIFLLGEIALDGNNPASLAVAFEYFLLSINCLSKIHSMNLTLVRQSFDTFTKGWYQRHPNKTNLLIEIFQNYFEEIYFQRVEIRVKYYSSITYRPLNELYSIFLAEVIAPQNGMGNNKEAKIDSKTLLRLTSDHEEQKKNSFCEESIPWVAADVSTSLSISLNLIEVRKYFEKDGEESLALFNNSKSIMTYFLRKFKNSTIKEVDNHNISAHEIKKIQCLASYIIGLEKILAAAPDKAVIDIKKYLSNWLKFLSQIDLWKQSKIRPADLSFAVEGIDQNPPPYNPEIIAEPAPDPARVVVENPPVDLIGFFNIYNADKNANFKRHRLFEKKSQAHTTIKDILLHAMKNPTDDKGNGGNRTARILHHHYGIIVGKKIAGQENVDSITELMQTKITADDSKRNLIMAFARELHAIHQEEELAVSVFYLAYNEKVKMDKMKSCVFSPHATNMSKPEERKTLIKIIEETNKSLLKRCGLYFFSPTHNRTHDVLKAQGVDVRQSNQSSEQLRNALIGMR